MLIKEADLKKKKKKVPVVNLIKSEGDKMNFNFRTPSSFPHHLLLYLYFFEFKLPQNLKKKNYCNISLAIKKIDNICK